MASTTSGLAILVSPKDLTLKEQIFRLRDGVKWKSESKKKSNIFMDLGKMRCWERACKYVCVCIYASVPCGWLGGQTEQSAVSIMNRNHHFLLSLTSISQHKEAWRL